MLKNHKDRYPIISIMGHVDHGKTSILKCLINKELKFEYKNITQSIKAYFSDKFNCINLIIIDTPGHNSFEKIRKVAANITDIILLIISVIDKIQDQTIESIRYAKILKIPIIIVINKIDKIDNIKNNKNIENIKNELYKYNIVSKNYGGNYNFIYTSATNNIGINNLLEEIKNTSKKLDLSINKNKLEIFLLERYLDKKEGQILYCIVKNGYIKLGDILIFNNSYGKVKYICDENNKRIIKTINSIPYYIYGISKNVNSNYYSYKIKKANNISEAKKICNNNFLYNNNKKNIYDINYIKSKINNINIKINKFNYIIKVNSQGSYYAVKNLLKEFNNINIINLSIGDINLNDINLSINTKSKILLFNIEINNYIINKLKNNNLLYKIFFTIYELKDFIYNDINKINNNKLNNFNTMIKVYNIFSNSKFLNILGCKIINGNIKINDKLKLYRNNKLIYNNLIISSLKNINKKIKEAKKNMECGILIKGDYIIKINDNLYK